MDTTKIPPNPNKKRKTNQNPETTFLINLQSCTKSKDLQTAISLFESALSQNLRLSLHHFNALLYLCSNFATDPSAKDSAIDYGFRVFNHMLSTKAVPNEASVTSIVRLASAKKDGDYAFELIKKMNKDYNLVPRLRTYDPALLCFCENLEAEKAYEVEEHMGSMGVRLEEQEIVALLKVSSETGRGERVYEYLQKLRNSVRCVSEGTTKAIEDWFRGEKATEVKGVSFDEGLVKEAVLKNGGGWHGLGWIGDGKWVSKRGSLDENGKCCCCGHQLVSVDIDDAETEKFAESIAGLAMEREVKANFSEFQDWLEQHADYEAIVDGANIGLYQQNFAEGGFSIPQVVQLKFGVCVPLLYIWLGSLQIIVCLTYYIYFLNIAIEQLDAVVKELYTRNGNKWPLIILHNKRLRSLLENPSHRKLVQEWMDKGVLYMTPHGSNDDWYWLYAAVKLRCLLATNDEMRDHIFELLGTNFFLKWKERHQVRYTFVKCNLKLQLPPPYSSVIQESEKGSWHVPILINNDESSQTWLCITRSTVVESCDKAKALENTETSENGHGLCSNDETLNSCNS
ncbi:hypothetical protein EZV62_026218 [Acer yangbiense]|uniref:ribonuclease P n=1 Tax=Acer yangbiense TaxID=1000413 RepID=A0A5C7GQ58_9ROSI|nr:hypothetical protein EZV62_026218 [Acer yangbiense]